MSETPLHDPTGRFSDRVADYVRFRPSYPADLIAMLADEFDLGPGRSVADIGSGTGILTSLLLDTGCRVFAVEPNSAMRGAAESMLAERAGFVSRDGVAEATGLPDRSVDVVTAAQAFHWFRENETRSEFHRILRPGGSVALIWNSRPPTGSPFLAAYESFLEEWGTDYLAVRASHDVGDTLPEFFGEGRMKIRHFPNEQVLNYEGLEGRLLSSSYTPAEGDPRRRPMLDALSRLFQRHSSDGVVRMEYVANVYYGSLEASGPRLT